MKNNPEIEIPEKEKEQLKADSDVAYWSKEYDISPEDLKNKGYNVGIHDKIIESYLQKQVNAH
jgi:hypothetical protein